MIETALKVESISLTPIEKDLYEKCLRQYPDMTVMAWKELRQNAVNVRDPGAKKFYVVNGILTEERPDKDERKELAGKN